MPGPVVLNGPEEEGIPHTLNVSFLGLKADLLLMSLDLAGVACSTGSACSSGSLLPSPVLQAMDVRPEVLHSALRFSLSPLLSEAEIDEAGAADQSPWYARLRQACINRQLPLSKFRSFELLVQETLPRPAFALISFRINSLRLTDCA